MALRVRWTGHTRVGFRRIVAYWEATHTGLLPEALAAVNARVAWLAAGHHLLGPRLRRLGAEHRSTREPRFGYLIFYHLEGDPPDTIAVLAIRHGRERPLRPSTLARYART